MEVSSETSDTSVDVATPSVGSRDLHECQYLSINGILFHSMANAHFTSRYVTNAIIDTLNLKHFIRCQISHW